MTQPEKSPSPPPAAELLLADAVEFCEQPVCRLRGDGTVLALNPALTLLTGWSEDAVVGRPLAARLHPDDAAPLGRCLVSLAIGAGARTTINLRLHQGGEAFVTVVFRAARRGEYVLMMGRGAGAAGGARQVGAPATAVGTWSYDVSHDLLCWSSITRQHFGLAAHVPVSLELFSRLVHPDDREQVTHAFKAALADGSTFAFEYRVHGGDGIERVIAARGQAFAGAHGRAAWFDGTTVDVTEAKQSQRALARALQVRDNFLAIASHELRTPLTGTLLQLNLLERRLGRGRDRQVVDTFIGHLHVQIDRLVRLVDEIIDISRISSDSLKIAPRRIDLARLIQDVGEAQRGHLLRAGCELHIDICDQLWAYADGDRLAQALVNVLDNAARHAPHTPVRLWVHAASGLAAIEVIDGGGGISAEDQERIFGKFERAVSRHERSGLGLGLTISRHILRAHQGDLVVTSVLGAGATFTMTLPMAA